MKENKTTNPMFTFVNSTAVDADRVSVRLIARGDERATTILEQMQSNEDLAQLGLKAFETADTPALIELINTAIDEVTIRLDATEVLDGIGNSDLDRLLKSRQSDRCKKFKTGQVTAHDYRACKTYISAMYAELMIREQTGKQYKATTTIDVDESDTDAIRRRIKSLQSKKCNTGKLLRAGDTSVQAVYDETCAEIDRLRTLVSTGTKQSKPAVVTKESLIAGLLSLSDEDLNNMPAEQAETLRTLRQSFIK